MTTKSDQLAPAKVTTLNMNDVSKPPEVKRIGDWNVTPITAYLQTEKKYYYQSYEDDDESKRMRRYFYVDEEPDMHWVQSGARVYKSDSSRVNESDKKWIK